MPSAGGSHDNSPRAVDINENGELQDADNNDDGTCCVDYNPLYGSQLFRAVIPDANAPGGQIVRYTVEATDDSCSDTLDENGEISVAGCYLFVDSSVKVRLRMHGCMDAWMNG